MRAIAVCGIVIAAISVHAAAAKECSSAKSVAIQAAVTRARLTIAPSALQSATELVLRDIRYDAHPGTQFNVILERHDDRSKRARVGTLSFYASTKGRAMTRTFDVTDELRQIAVSAADLKNVDVVFEATTGRGGSDAKPTFDPRSALTIGALELRVKEK